MKTLIRYDFIKEGKTVDSIDANAITNSDAQGVAMALNAEILEVTK